MNEAIVFLGTMLILCYITIKFATRGLKEVGK